MIGYVKWVRLSFRAISTNSRIPAGPYMSSVSSPPWKERDPRRPGRPKIWSPCICVMKIFSILRGFTVVCRIWCCVASPQSNNHTVPRSSSNFKTSADVLRCLEGIPAPVPRNNNCMLPLLSLVVVIIQKILAEACFGVVIRFFDFCPPREDTFAETAFELCHQVENRLFLGMFLKIKD